MLPNLLTLFRLLSTPLIFYMISLGWTYHPAFLFMVAAITDWFDGYFARKYNAASDFGKLFDPLVDRIFIAAVIVALFIYRETPPLWAVGVLLARDILLLAGGQILHKQKGKRISVNMTGKVATGWLMTAVVIMIAGWPIAIYVFYVGLALSVIAALQYMKKALNLLALKN